MDTLHQVTNNLLHLDKYLVTFVATHGLWTYLAAFAVIFAETGLVIVPFLPGDSLLFALGSLTALPTNPLHLFLLWPLLILAATIGNEVNYRIGRVLGPNLFSNGHARLIDKKHFEEAHQFYEKHGGKTLLFARFIPVIRSFAPFVAGVSAMSLVSFHRYNISSALLWVSSLLGIGYFFGSRPFVQTHFSMVLYGIVFISLLPPLITFLNQKIRQRLRTPR